MQVQISRWSFKANGRHIQCRRKLKLAGLPPKNACQVRDRMDFGHNILL